MGLEGDSSSSTLSQDGDTWCDTIRPVARKLVLVPRPDPRRVSRRLRALGTLVLVAGVVAAAWMYWIGTHRAGPTIEELFPGSTAANERQMRLLYGHAVGFLYDLYQDWRSPAGEALTVIALSTAASAACFRLAWAREHHS